MERLPASLSKPLERLLENEVFCQNIQGYTKDGLNSLHGILDEDSYCPASYLLTLNYILTNNLPFETLLSHLPESLHQEYLSTCQSVSKVSNVFDEEYSGREHSWNSLSIPALTNVTWEMAIEEGKEFWRVSLHTSDHKTKTLRVEYESMAMAVLKLGQAIQHISSTNVKELPL